MTMLRVLVLMVMAFQLAGCASYFKKKDCESINWFEHGQKVAMRGQWLNADPVVNECRKVEADIQESQLDKGFKSGVEKYCTNTNAYIIGKSGDFFSRDICEGPQINVLVAEHRKGTVDYCAKSNGFVAGTSGKKYQNVCPKELEPAFLPEYRKGRKKYVQSLIDSKSSEVRSLDMDILHKRNNLSFARSRLSALEAEKSGLESSKSAAMINQQSQLVTHFNSQISVLDSNINSKKSEVFSLQSDLNTLENNRDKLQKDISAFKEELPSLDNP